MTRTYRPTRRQFLGAGLAAGSGFWLGGQTGYSLAAPASRKKLPVAAVVTEYRGNSHTDVILSKILEGWNHDGGPGPDLELVGLYTDQIPKNDMSRAMAEKHGFRIFDKIEDAVTLGTDKVQVAGVFSIGEHGNYPMTPDTNQRMYPRRRFFDGIVAAFKKSGSVVPVFSDKHLSYNWKDAKHMYDTAQRMSIPFMAGSSLPVAWRVPPMALPMGCQITEAIATGYGGLESYGFHALETLQCMVERRQGGESGVASVQAVTGEAILAAEKAGRWSRKLLVSAGKTGLPLRKPSDELITDNTVIYLIEYRDGLQAAVAMKTNATISFAFACNTDGKQQQAATSVRLHEEKPYTHFTHLLKAVEHMIHTGKPAYPVERTLLTTGVLDALMHSLADGGKRIETPELAIAYQPVEWPYAEGVPPTDKP